jgi:UDP-N-acetylglucosamine--N-acetylmuramyl-(pentapeptide) pyrophosphoryl-undecaprenol N-acetylglucosamine transferase
MHQKLKDTLTSYKKIFFVGGGTGGHVQPILNIIEDLREHKIDNEYIWLGGSDSQESSSAQENNIPFISIPTLKLSTTQSPKILLYPFVLLQGIFQVRKILKNTLRNAEKQYNGVQGKGTV